MKNLGDVILEDMGAFIPMHEVLVTYRDEEKLIISVITDQINEHHEFAPLRSFLEGKQYNGKAINLTIIMDDIDDYENEPGETIVYCNRLGSITYSIICVKQIIRALFARRR
jgi:hypothetical protein